MNVQIFQMQDKSSVYNNINTLSVVHVINNEEYRFTINHQYIII